MDDLAIARAIHVIAVVIWLGGVSMITTIVLPAMSHSHDGGATLFEMVERRFTRQARLSTLLAGATGFYMVERLDIWDRFESFGYWWMHAMVGIWLVFTLVLFVAEPLYLHRWFQARVQTDPQSTVALIQWFHRILLALSVITIFGAVAGAHGLFLF
jgi:uncharacterized membrane protein